MTLIYLNSNQLQRYDINACDPRTIDSRTLTRYPFNLIIQTDEIPNENQYEVIYNQPNYSSQYSNYNHINRGNIFYYKNTNIDNPFPNILFYNKPYVQKQIKTPLDIYQTIYIRDNTNYPIITPSQFMNDSILHRESILSSYFIPINKQKYL